MKDTIFKLINQEKKRQIKTIGMIPSENICSSNVRKAVGSVLMHKYAEGQVAKRYYQGNEFADQVEATCKERALQAFQLDPKEWAVNVQPYSGSPANLAVYNALLKPGDKIMAMYLPDGGHLSHGWQLKDKKVSIVSKIFEIVYYHVEKETEVFDYNKITTLAKQEKPQLIVSGGTAYSRDIDHQKMATAAHSVGAYYLADVSHEAGLIAAQVLGNPFLYADVVMMTTHKTLRGPRGAMIFSRKKCPINDENLSNKIDFSVFPGLQGGPHLHTIAGIAVALNECQQESFKKYAEQIKKNAQVFANFFKKKNYHVVSGGTDKHLILLDLRGSGISAWVAAWILEVVGIVLNRNTVPSETASPFYPSGLRFGTPIITTRGMKEKEVETIARWMDEVMIYSKKWQIPEDKETRLKFLKDFKKEIFQDKLLLKLKKEVTTFASGYPLFEEK